MKAIAQGIYGRFTELTGGLHNDLYNAVSGRMYLQQAPQDVQFPYVVFSFPAVTLEFNFTNRFENARVQFSIFSIKESALELEDIRTKLQTLYDFCDMTLTGYYPVYMRRENAVLMRDDRPSWHCAIDYRVFVEKS